jgi:hypothetical protein
MGPKRGPDTKADWPTDRRSQYLQRPTVGEPVCLGVRHTSGTHDQFFFILDFGFEVSQKPGLTEDIYIIVSFEKLGGKPPVVKKL